MILIRTFTIAGFLGFALLGQNSLAQTPSSAELVQLSKECETLLQTSVLDFYLPCLDQQNGGYFENLDAKGEFTGGGGKFITLQARQLWTFSVLAENNIQREACLAAATHGYKFITTKFFDFEHQGYFNQLNDDGSVRDPRKHAYMNSFVLYALVAYHRATGLKEPLDKALELFNLLEAKAHDSENGGYREYFERNWQEVGTDAPRMVGAPGTKTYNTHLHLLESFTELYRATKHPLVRKRLSELVAINTLSVRLPQFGCNVDAWHPDWQVVQTSDNFRASYGHDVECAWLVLDAANALEIDDSVFRSWATDLVEYSLKHGYDREHGGFFYTGELGKPAGDTHKEWWVQAEAIVCLLDLYRITGDLKYFRSFQETFAFIKKYQIAREGGWWASREADGSPSSNRSRTSMWQGGYHSGRSLLRSSQLLRKIANEK